MAGATDAATQLSFYGTNRNGYDVMSTASAMTFPANPAMAGFFGSGFDLNSSGFTFDSNKALLGGSAGALTGGVGFRLPRGSGGSGDAMARFAEWLPNLSISASKRVIDKSIKNETRP